MLANTRLRTPISLYEPQERNLHPSAAHKPLHDATVADLDSSHLGLRLFDFIARRVKIPARPKQCLAVSVQVLRSPICRIPERYKPFRAWLLNSQSDRAKFLTGSATLWHSNYSGTTAMASTSSNHSSRTRRRTSTAVLTGGWVTSIYLSRTSRKTGACLMSTK